MKDLIILSYLDTIMKAIKDYFSSYARSEDVQVLSCILKAAGWVNNSGTYTQTVACVGVTSDMNLSAPEVLSTGIRETDIALNTALGILCAPGNFGETLDGQLKWTCYDNIPTTDITIRMRVSKLS